MENNSEEECLLNHTHNSKKGGLKTMPFIIVNESLERLASFGLQPNMIIYLTTFYHMEAAAASSLIGIWSAFSNGLAIVGAFLSDSYLGRFKVIAIGSISSLIGICMLWLTTVIPQLRPSPCNNQQSDCNGTTTAAQYALILSSLGLISIGAGFVRPCSIVFGADQLDNKRNPENERVIDSYFNWFYASVGVSTVLGVTIIVYIQDNLGWQIGFGVPAILMVLSVSMFLMGSPLYVKVKAKGSLLTELFQVVVAVFRKRNLDVQMNYSDDYYYKAPESKFLVPSSDFRCINRACIIQDPYRELKSDGTASNPWSLCSVEQVESLKSFFKVVPMWSTSFMPILSMTIPMVMFQLQTVDRHVFPGYQFEIPAGSFNYLSLLILAIWSVFYVRVLVPLLVTRYPRGISQGFRMGTGLIISCVGTALAAVTEYIRRNKAINEGFEDDPNAVLNMSAMWFVPQFALFGLAEALYAVGLLEFMYAVFPKSMSSFAPAICALSTCVANLISSLLVSVVDGVTSAGGNTSWLSTNINRGHLDYYYCLILFLSVINFLYFLFINLSVL